MFGQSKKTQEVATSPKSPQGMKCLVSHGTKIEGNFNCPEDVRIDGEIIGEINCKMKFILGREGKIDGKIYAKDCIVNGTVIGELIIDGLLILGESALIQGSIHAGKMQVDQGATYNGQCSVGVHVKKNKQKPSSANVN